MGELHIIIPTVHVNSIEEAVKVFVSELKENPERGAELAQTLIGRLQKGSVVSVLFSVE